MARRTTDSRTLAEQAFKAATTKPADLPAAAPSVPGVKEMVSLRIDRDVLDFFQEEDPAGRTASTRRCARPRGSEP